MPGAAPEARGRRADSTGARPRRPLRGREPLIGGRIVDADADNGSTVRVASTGTPAEPAEHAAHAGRPPPRSRPWNAGPRLPPAETHLVEGLLRANAGARSAAAKHQPPGDAGAAGPDETTAARRR